MKEDTNTLLLLFLHSQYHSSVELVLCFMASQCSVHKALDKPWYYLLDDLG